MKTESQKISETLLLLRIVEKDRNILGRLKFQKEVFLAEWTLLESNLGGLFFKFFRYNLGPYSKDLAETFEFLCQKGFIHKSNFRLTERGEYLNEFVEKTLKSYQNNSKIFHAVDSTVKKYSHFNGQELKNQVYRLKVKPFDLPEKELTVEKIPSFTDIIVPQQFSSTLNFQIPLSLERDLKIEFGMEKKNWENIEKHYPKALKRAENRLRVALGN